MAKAKIPRSIYHRALDLRRSYEVDIGDKSAFCVHPLATIQARGGVMTFGRKQKANQIDQAAQQRQAEELAKADNIEKKKLAAAARSRRGRASLISGSETGLSDTLG